MARTHPHAEATYTVVPLEDGTFGVQVAIPETYPTTVKPFATARTTPGPGSSHKVRSKPAPPARSVVSARPVAAAAAELTPLGSGYLGEFATTRAGGGGAVLRQHL
jgi:hypothetical protein